MDGLDLKCLQMICPLHVEQTHLKHCLLPQAVKARPRSYSSLGGRVPFVHVNSAEYQPEPGDSIMERRGIFSASIHMLQWLTRGHLVEWVSEEARDNAYYNEALRLLVNRELIPHSHNPELYHILYAKHLIVNLLKYRYVPGDERGVILRSEVQPNSNNNNRSRRSRGRHRSRTVVQGNQQLLSATTRAVDHSLMAAVYNSMPFVLVKDVWDYNTNTSVDGTAEILIQCAHGPCQRYIPVVQDKPWCAPCERIEVHAPFMVHDADFNSCEDQCTSCFRIEDGHRIQNQ